MVYLYCQNMRCSQRQFSDHYMVEARLIVKDEDALSALLSAASLSHLSIDTLAQDAIDDRPALLSRLKADGVEKLADRQKLANALSKAARARGLEPRPKPPTQRPKK